jgi:hypothetical protein
VTCRVALVQLFDQARTQDHVRPRRRDIEFGGQNGGGHKSII